MSKLIVGKLEIDGNEKVIVPLAKKQEVMEHQKKMAALIAAAYLYRDNPCEESIYKLLHAATDL